MTFMDKFSEWLKAERGNLTKLADAIGVTYGAIPQWKGIVPTERLFAVSAFTGIPMEELRPDLAKAAKQISERRASDGAAA